MTKKKAKKTIVTFILDRSGSMATIHGDVVGGYNTFIKTLQRSGEAIRFNLVQFDNHSLDKVVVNTKIDEVNEMQHHDFQPRGGTPLIDAVYASIKATEELVGKKNRNVSIVIFTDGMENASKLHTNTELKALIEEKQGAGWSFQYLGSEINAYADAGSVGIGRGQTVSVGAGKAADSFMYAARNTVAYASTGNSKFASFSDVDKQNLDDKWDTAVKTKDSSENKSSAVK